MRGLGIIVVFQLAGEVLVTLTGFLSWAGTWPVATLACSIKGLGASGIGGVYRWFSSEKPNTILYSHCSRCSCLSGGFGRPLAGYQSWSSFEYGRGASCDRQGRPVARKGGI